MEHHLLYPFPMKYLHLKSLLLLILLWQSASAQDKFRNVKNEAFKAGEILKYRIHYGFMDAGEAILEVKDELHPVGSRKTFHVVGTGRTKGAFDWFFKVRDRY